MRDSLRTRLFASYLFMLVVSLGVICISLIVFLSRQPEPPNYEVLFRTAQNLNVDQIQRIFSPRPMRMAQNHAYLQTFAEDHEVRVLLLNLRDRTLRFDTDSAPLTPQHSVDLRFDNSYSINNSRLVSRFTNPVSVIVGSFWDASGQEWLFVGIETPRSDQALLLADTRSQRSLRTALAQFGNSLGGPLLQSAVIGLLTAFVLAALISGTIARPLRRVASAAQKIAQGDYQQVIEVTGPLEVRSVAETFNQMSHEVQSTQQAQRDFMANVSHDLKTPLTSIQGYSQAIMDGTVKDPAHAANIIYDEAGRLGRMVADLTDLARLQAGGIEMQIAQIDLGQIVEAITQRLQVVAAKKGIKMSLQLDPLPPIQGDGDRLAQVLTNLISNAINYTPINGKVFIEAQRADGGVQFRVRDTGIGIPPDEISRIFERFYQVDKSRGPKRGTGLGLAIVKEIIQAHGGRITVTSPGENLGSTFSVWLPLAKYIDHEKGQHGRNADLERRGA